ncbi:thiol-disulfide isomerase/thioredoxin [Virgibacillus natechei]|uniref:Thiol-disulfide isomerase/thioredoxin n=1 Tax=Virgibacillus natechei TaxID=1216297 RepID=A0ABS4IDB2_9BACI|nr:thioredoxin family protein [Virgibacillus natechei]MBP1968927.1 thiol-disulfide isomerase/thioredoxin [Virgibacillus natechei]UZD11718.1 thioredoxin family protein [Virgibacillus natechei]
MKKLETVEQFNEWKNNENIIMFFTAGWCPDCRVIEPVLPEIEAKYPEFTFVEVNRDQFIELCQEYDVFGIPSFLAFKDGNEVGRYVNKERKTKDQIEQFIEGIG